MENIDRINGDMNSKIGIDFENQNDTLDQKHH